MESGNFESGSTCSAVLMTPKNFIFANVGDSRSVLISRNRVRFETTDHKPTDFPGSTVFSISLLYNKLIQSDKEYTDMVVLFKWTEWTGIWHCLELLAIFFWNNIQLRTFSIDSTISFINQLLRCQPSPLLNANKKTINTCCLLATEYLTFSGQSNL